MSAPAPGGHTLDALARRVCAAAGTELELALADLRGERPDPATPDALRAGWSIPDLTIPTLDTMEPS